MWNEMMNRILNLCLASTLALMLPAMSKATEAFVFAGCDSHGKSIPAHPDSGLPILVSTIAGEGDLQIRYNPEILPRLSAKARLFFYAQQCARLGLDNAASSARRADCVALNTLLDSEQLKYGELPALQAELRFTPEEWTLLPGPPRTIDLSNCRASSGDVLRLPLTREASPRQDAWNNCVRACADRLWHCQKSTGDNCQVAYDQCRSNCPE